MTRAYVADTDGARASAAPTTSRWPRRRSTPIVDATSQALIDRGHAYAVEGDVYFRVRSDPQYGSLSHRVVDADGPGRGRRGRST